MRKKWLEKHKKLYVIEGIEELKKQQLMMTASLYQYQGLD